jgi:hypothetical protein
MASLLNLPIMLTSEDSANLLQHEHRMHRTAQHQWGHVIQLRRHVCHSKMVIQNIMHHNNDGPLATLHAPSSQQYHCSSSNISLHDMLTDP